MRREYKRERNLHFLDFVFTECKLAKWQLKRIKFYGLEVCNLICVKILAIPSFSVLRGGIYCYN